MTDAEALIFALFEQQVPEVAAGGVVVEGVARIPGVRTKVAVSCLDEDIDPVEMCVGPDETHVAAIVAALDGEPIDILPWDEDLAFCVTAAFGHVDVSKLIIDEEGQELTIMVPDDELLKTIGRRGEHAQLASSLLGWSLRVQSERRAGCSVIRGPSTDTDPDPFVMIIEPGVLE